MERDREVSWHSGASRQFEFHEFVPGPSNRDPCLNLPDHVSASANYVSSSKFPSATYKTAESPTPPPHNASTKKTSPLLFYEPPPSGPLIISTSSNDNPVATIKSESPGQCSQVRRGQTETKPIGSCSTSLPSSKSPVSLSPCKSVSQNPIEVRVPTYEAADRSSSERLISIRGAENGENHLECSDVSLPTDLSSPLSVDTKVGENVQSAGSFSECGVCGPEKAIWVPSISETGEPLIESTSGHGQTIKIDPVDTFWIQCDCCEKWFHGSCVGVEEYEDALIDKFHCQSCSVENGPTKMREVLLRHRFAFDDMSQAKLPPEIGTEVWIKKFVETEGRIPPPCHDQAIVFEDGFEFMECFKRKEEWRKVYLIKITRGLEMRMPDKGDNFGLHSIVELFGRDYKVDTIDVYRQVTHSMSIGAFYDKITAKERPRLYNILSLEFSQNEVMRKLVSPPILVLELSFVHKLWPDRNDLINWDPELRHIVEVLEEHRRNKPEVALFCLCGMAGSYTDFHIDFGGSSVWYHIYQGRKIFYIVEPTAVYLDLFEKYQRSESKTEVFFGDLLPPGALRRVVIEEGQTLMVPSGWIHAVYTPVDSLVFGGNFLHALNTRMQLKVYEMEQRLKKEIGTEDRFLFPNFELVHWYAARSFILEQLREANDEGNRADQYIMDAAVALLPRLKEWMRRDKEEKSDVPLSFGDVVTKLQKEINKQERVRRALSPRSRSPKKKWKKRKSEEHDSFTEENRDCSFDLVSVANVNKVEPETKVSPLSTESETFEANPATTMRLDSVELDSEIPVIKLTKKGRSYASHVVEKPDPMLEDVNMTQMFARRSSSGRQPRPAAWLAAAVGLDELEKTSKLLEESGEQFALREPISYDAEMERACEEEEAELLREENRKKKNRRIEPAQKDVQIRMPKKKPSTTKQRLAAKLKLK